VPLGIRGVKFAGLLETDDSPLQIALLPQGNAEVVVGLAVLGIQFDGLLVFGDGPLRILLVMQGISEAEMGLGRLRADSYGRPPMAHAFLKQCGLNLLPLIP
jgi:hypothetical protein